MSCLKEYFMCEIKQSRFPLKCPQHKCESEVTPAVLSSVLNQTEMGIFYQRTFDHAAASKDISWCPTPDCKFAFVFDKDTELHCQCCEKHYCLNCRVEFHTGQTCAEYQVSNQFSSLDDQFEKFVKGKKFKQCTSCQ